MRSLALILVLLCSACDRPEQHTYMEYERLCHTNPGALGIQLNDCQTWATTACLNSGCFI